ncbi:DUF4065 domain-containing protein [Pontibacter sp. KCTC 32443]|uniref:Panacea domain-containing protein n=1 Tax=Pontibacter TaxID=323449 RepID=UPI00164CE522|nr:MULTISPECIES: type II toxin-antitoxin system antitoxin SocA domain-containing protein [Pontibacter]MBC5775734.1 DUF4065 domain-containing protein [Pontibacter sp. KCTC 32443]
MYNINTICDYVILRLKSEGEDFLTNLRLQKLLYYVQAWHLAFNKEKLFEGDFQAWIHGPVNREIYDRFKDSKGLYSEIHLADLLDENCFQNIDEESRKHVDVILENYGKFSGTQLEYMTHQEEPWIDARKGYSPSQRCEIVINNELMGDYYRARLQ